jgi:hypothetical protein
MGTGRAAASKNEESPEYLLQPSEKENQGLKNMDNADEGR